MMRRGKQNKKIKDGRVLLKLQQPKFRIKNLSGVLNVIPLRGGCGTAALSMITGISAKIIDKELPKSVDYWSDRRMKAFLQERDYTVTEITVSKVCQKFTINDQLITPKHVLLAGQNIYPNEGTWSVIHMGMKYHNFEMEPLSPLEFVNNPTDTLYAITHKKWERY